MVRAGRTLPLAHRDGTAQLRPRRIQVFRISAPAVHRTTPRSRLSASRGDREPLAGRGRIGAARPRRPSADARTLRRARATPPDRLVAEVRARRLQLPPSGYLRGDRLPVSIDVLSQYAASRFRRRGVRPRRAASAGAESARSPPAGPRRYVDLPQPLPAGSRPARVLPDRRPAWRQSAALGRALHARAHLPRRAVTARRSGKAAAAAKDSSPRRGGRRP